MGTARCGPACQVVWGGGETSPLPDSPKQDQEGAQGVAKDDTQSGRKSQVFHLQSCTYGLSLCGICRFVDVDGERQSKVDVRPRKNHKVLTQHLFYRNYLMGSGYCLL